MVRKEYNCPNCKRDDYFTAYTVATMKFRDVYTVIDQDDSTIYLIEDDEVQPADPTSVNLKCENCGFKGDLDMTTGEFKNHNLEELNEECDCWKHC